MIAWSKRSYHYEDEEGNKIYVKTSTGDNWVEVTQWSSDFVKTIFVNDDVTWRKSQDRIPIRDYTVYDITMDVVAVLHKEIS